MYTIVACNLHTSTWIFWIFWSDINYGRVSSDRSGCSSCRMDLKESA